MNEKIEQEVKKILEIVKLCPGNLQEKCFELLFNLTFNNNEGKDAGRPETIIPTETETKNENNLEGNLEDRNISGFKLPGNVLAFLRKNKLSQNDLDKLFILDHEPILPTYKIKGETTTQSQLQKVFMILLENAILKNQFKATYEELRDTCKEDGLFDGNFNKMLKRNYLYFKGAITKSNVLENGDVELTGSGMEKMAEVIKLLCE